MKNPWLPLAVAGLAVAAATWWAFSRFAERESELRREEAQVRRALEINRRARDELRAVAATPAPAPATEPAVPAPAAAAPQTNRERTTQAVEKLRRMPEYAPFIRRDLRRMTMRVYGDLLRELDLSPERMEAFKAMMDARFGSARELGDACGRNGIAEGSAEYSRLMREHHADFERRCREFLGEAEYATYADYQKALHWRTNQQFELDYFIADQGAPPVSEAQKRTLYAAHLEAQKIPLDPALANATSVEQQRWRDRRMLEFAGPALTESQRKSLAAYLDFSTARGAAMGRLYYPDKPADSIVMSVGVTPP